MRLLACRSLGTSASSRPPAMNVFDRRIKQIQKDRAMLCEDPEFFQYFREEIASRMADRLKDIKRSFPVVAEVGSNVGNLARHLQDVQGIERLIQIESSKKMAEHKIACPNLKIHRLQADEEALPLRPQSVDLVLSCLSLHWVNDLPGTLKQIRRALKPDGAFVAAMIGGNSLQELRSSFLLADMERLGGISPHVSPMAFVRDVGSLMQNAGFSLPTVDSDTLTIPYPDMFTLMYHLKGMGENNAVLERREHISRDVFLSAAAAYSSIYGDHTLDGMIPATVQVLYMIGWNPDPSQAKPIQRGSAQKSLKDIGTEK